MSHSKTKPHLAVLAANLIFGANFSVVKYITPSIIQPFGLNVARVVVTTTLFWLLLLPQRKKITDTYKRNEKYSYWLPDKSDWSRIIICGLTGVAINQMLFIKGLSMTYSTHGALLMLCTPILITGIAFWLIREPVTWKKMLGLVLGVTGATILITSRERTGSGSNVMLGDIFIVINAICYAFYLVLVKPLMLKYHALQVITWVFTVGTVFIIPFGWNEFITPAWSNFNFLQLAAIGFVVFGATFFAYLFNIYGVQHLGAGVTGSYIYSQPIFAAMIAWLFLEEPFTAEKWIAGVLIFLGVWLVNRK
jgi:drug/metabolite transporter (DMT)-like permease